MEKIKKIVLAYSGGLDTSVILRWLKETYQAEVVAFVADLGQGDEIAPLREKAVNSGASEVFIEDVKEEFVSDYIFPMFRAGAIYEGCYLLGTSIARPLIAAKQMQIAAQTGADAVSHGATGKGNDQVRFEISYYTFDPSIKIIAPWKIWDFKSRQDLVNYAKKFDIPVPVTAAKPYSSDRNLLHISFEGGILEDPWREPDPEMFVLTVAPEEAPDEPEYIEIDFQDGDPQAINGVSMSPAALLAELNLLGGRHGIGRVDLVENRYVGMKSRGVYETPGGTIWYHAHRAIESLTMDREVMHLRDSLIPKYASLVYNGYWFSPERSVLQEMINASQAGVSGAVRMKLYKGNAMIVGRKAARSLYSEDFATFEEDTVYDQKDADGFIRLNALRLRIKTLAEKKNK